MSRVLVVPAAGSGTRLGAALPKVLVPVAGISMIDRVFALYDGFVEHAVVVVNPAARAPVEAHLASADPGFTTECVVQDRPTGMLDAVLLAQPQVRRRYPSHVWVTWCDQVAVHPQTVTRLSSLTRPGDSCALVLPTVRSRDPYIHLARDRSGRIIKVLHRREGDAMPAEGESDVGLFAMTAHAFLESLTHYARGVETGKGTGEVNFLPFIPWLAARDEVVTFPAHDSIEARGINTPADLAALEIYLAGR